MSTASEGPVAYKTAMLQGRTISDWRVETWA